MGAFILFFGILFLYQAKKTSIQRHFVPALFLKMLAGMGVGLIYQYYYLSGDTWGYFKDASYLLSLAKENFDTYLHFMCYGGEFNASEVTQFLVHQNERAILMSKIVSLSLLFFGENYWFTAQVFSFLSFVGCWFLANQLVRFYPNTTKATLIAFLYFPSFVFWSSGILKESLLLASLTVAVSLTLEYKTAIPLFKKVVYGCLIFGLLYFIFKLKYYYGIILSPCLIILIFYYQFKNTLTPKILVSTCLLLLISTVVFLSQNHYNLRFESVLNVIVDNQQWMLEKNTDAVRNILLPALEPHLFSFLKHSPQAIWEGLFRPYLWEAHNEMALFISIENSFLFLLFLLSIFSLSYRNSLKFMHLTQKIEVSMILLYSFSLLLFITLAIPNLGALSRYKIGFMPFLLFLSLVQLELCYKASQRKKEVV